MKPADYPFPIRVLLVATLVLFVVNVFFFSGPLSAFFAWANSITPGLATLIGSLIGLSVIGWQTRQGFKNLIASQEHRAEKEREARADQARIEREATNEQSERERKALAAALTGELLSLWYIVGNSRGWYTVNTALLKVMEREGARTKEGTFTLPTFHVPIYEANVEKLGLLGSSVAGDVARVFSRASLTSTSQDKFNVDIKWWITTYESVVESMDDWMEDISLVVKRLIALEQGNIDPGTLFELEQQREQRKRNAAPGGKPRGSVMTNFGQKRSVGAICLRLGHRPARMSERSEKRGCTTASSAATRSRRPSRPAGRAWSPAGS
jgi:hypothetical protein